MGLIAKAKAVLDKGANKQYLLPSTTKSRALWEAKSPEGYKKADSDYVKYHALLKDGAEPKSNPSHTNVPCYASCRPGFDKYDMTCLPLQRKGVLDLVEAYEFFNSLTEIGVIPEGVQLWEDKNGVVCNIPPGIGNPHNIYAALVAYRLVDSCPAFVWDFNFIMAQEGKRHPLQVFPYLVGKHNIAGGHCFINVDTYGSGVLGQTNNPTLGLAAKIYFDQQDNRGKDDYEKHSTMVNAAIAEVVKQITPTLKIKSGNEKWAADVDTPRYVLEKPEDSLNPDLYELYTIPNITNQQIEEFLSDRFTKEKK
jgi:hypothetical protein